MNGIEVRFWLDGWKAPVSLKGFEDEKLASLLASCLKAGGAKEVVVVTMREVVIEYD